MTLNDPSPSDGLQSEPKEYASHYWFARHSKSIIFMIIALAAVGSYLAFTLPVSVFPVTDFPRIIIGVDNGVTPIDQMLVTVTRPVEQAVNRVPGLESIRSVTSRGQAEVNLFFDWNVDMAQTLQLVDSALARIQNTLPATATVDSHRLDFSSFPIIGYSLTSDTVSQTTLWELATYDIKPRLNRLTGVMEVNVQGGQEPEFQIVPDPARMQRTKVTVTDILEAVRRTNQIDSPGLLERNHQLFLGLVSGQVHNTQEISNIVVKTTGAGVPVRIEEVASVSRSVKPVYTIVTADAKPAVLVSVNRQPSSNTVAVADEVHREIEAIRKTLPAGVELRAYYDQSDLVKQSIGSVRDSILIGLFLAGLIIWLFLRDWGTAVMTGLVVPVTMAVTFIAMKILGESFNMMTLGGLAAAVGLVIDDKIVVVENIVLHRDAGEGPLQATASALKELAMPLVGSTLTPIVVFLPLITITGVTGTFFRALAVAMSVSLLTSLVLALVWTSNLSTYLVRRGRHGAVKGLESSEAREKESDQLHGAVSETEEVRHMRHLMAAEEASMHGFFGRVIHFYEKWLRRTLRHPGKLTLACVLLIAGSYFCYSRLGSDLLPAMDEGGFILDYIMPAGSSLQETDRVITHVERIIRAIPEVESTSRRTGLELGLAAVTEANTGDIAVKLKVDRKRSMDDILSEVRAQVATHEPALDIELIQVLQDMIGDLTGAPEPVEIKLFSENPALLETWAPKVAEAIQGVDIGGKNPVVDVQDGIDNTVSGPAVSFELDPVAAARAGFTPEELMINATAVLEGEPAAEPIITNDKPYTLRVRYPEENRLTLESMSNTLITSATGQTATLGSLGSIRELPGQNQIHRENLQRNVSVTARLEGVDMGTGVAAVQKVVRDLNLPAEIRATYGGTYQEQQKSFHDLVIVLLLALVLIFLVLLAEFRTVSAPVSILASAILSTAGVFLALLLTNTTFNISSFMGLIMVIGIVAKNGILLLDADQKFRLIGYSPLESMVQAGRRRLRPIVMTALASVAGMFPLAFGLGAGSQMLQPLAISVIGGIVISMFLSLIVTPVTHFFLTSKDSH